MTIWSLLYPSWLKQLPDKCLLTEYIYIMVTQIMELGVMLSRREYLLQ